jgi:uncharacterized OsmC-like protein
MADIKSSIEAAVAYLTEHPQEALYTDSEATATLESGLRCRIVGGAGETLITDMPAAVGGSAAAPTPGWLFRAALAACDASLVAMQAAREGVSLSLLEVKVDSESDDRGILGMDKAVPAGPLSMRVRIRLQGDATPERLAEIARLGVAHCPIHDAAERAIPIGVEVDS